MLTKSDKAIAGALGSAAALFIGYYLGWPVEVQGAASVLISGCLVWFVPNKAAS